MDQKENGDATFGAREHLESVATIVRAADRSLHVPPSIFIVWGLFGTIINGAQQMRAAGVAVPPDHLFHLPMLLIAIAATAWISRRAAGRETLIDRHAGIVFSVVFGVLLIANLFGSHAMVSHQAMGCSGASAWRWLC